MAFYRFLDWRYDVARRRLIFFNVGVLLHFADMQAVGGVGVWLG